jgi:MtN3 and saliva related transmembrane protein
MNWTATIGLIAAVLTTSSFVPQAWKIFRHKKVKDLSLTMYAMMFTGQAGWLVYGLLIHDTPLILANIIGCTLTGAILLFKIILKDQE